MAVGSNPPFQHKKVLWIGTQTTPKMTLGNRSYTGKVPVVTAHIFNNLKMKVWRPVTVYRRASRIGEYRSSRYVLSDAPPRKTVLRQMAI